MIQLVYKFRIKEAQGPQITCPQDAYRIIKDLWNKDTIEQQEQFKVLYLNGANSVIRVFPWQQEEQAW